MKSLQLKFHIKESSCIKDLYDYELVKKGCVCKNISLRSNFHKSTKSKMDHNLNVDFV